MNDFLTDAEPTKKPSNSLISDSISKLSEFTDPPYKILSFLKE